MQYIRSIKRVIPKVPTGKTILYMHGYGGFNWQAKRQLKVLREAGYSIIALDFTYVLRAHNPQELIDLMDEVDTFMQNEKLIDKELLIVGISLGGLVGYNMLRRHKELTKLLVITGGNISLLPSKKSLKKKWKITREQLADRWHEINMYTPAGRLKDKHIIMMLPVRDKVINPNEVLAELDIQKQYNNIKLLMTKGGHYRTVITSTIIKPRIILKLLKELN
ncbi:MAG TPA: alpha/beta hydrolase [Candidatus Saccharimonadales bacterium]|nr:alpha/beta hydrolase [Candidatus Saccharimonadales bacterium]